MDIRDAFFYELYSLMEQDPKVILLTADADAFGIAAIRKDFPRQFMDTGVAEQNTVLMATGMAMRGFRPFVYSIAPFITFRCFEQLKVNVCSMNLPITVVGLGAGLSFGFDGPTHHAIQDIGVMRMLPEMSIYSPSDSVTMRHSVNLIMKQNGPAYIRLDKGDLDLSLDNMFDSGLGTRSFGIKNRVRYPTDICVYTHGYMRYVLQDLFENDFKDFNIWLYDVYQLKPLPHIVPTSRRICVVEEHAKTGGLFDILSTTLWGHQVSHISLPDKQIFQYGDRLWLHKQFGIDRVSIHTKLLTLLNEEKDGRVPLAG